MGDTTIAAAFSLILGERIEQEEKGYDAEHDQEHDDGELVAASLSFAIRAYEADKFRCSTLPDPVYIWPFKEPMPPMKAEMRDIVIAAAFLVAEIERWLTCDE